MTNMALTDLKLRSLKPAQSAFKLSDSGGLYVMVQPTGTKVWRLAYRFGGKQKSLALGKYPAVSLREARGRRDAAKRLLEQGIDPSAAKRAEQRLELIAQSNTFEAVANEWFENKRRSWVESYAVRLKSRLDQDLLPALGKRPIADIQPLEVLDAIRAIERRDAVEMAKRVMQMASGIFRYGVATAKCSRDPTTDLRGALKPAAAPKHRSALPASALPEFLVKLAAYDGDAATRLALKLVLLTFVRSSELRFARWTEFEELDGAKSLWRIPADRMKMRRPHLVPLAPQAVTIVKELAKLTGDSAYLLPASTGSGVMSENTLLFALYRLGYHSRATVHGFRSTASTILNEVEFNSDWIEMQLAHADASVRGIYNAAEWLAGRRKMLCWWADYLGRAERAGRQLAANGGSSRRKNGQPPKLAA
jgi:integrase